MAEPTILEAIIEHGEMLGILVTAVATICLWWVTKTLAKETRRMAAASAQPEVVVTIEPNRWSLMDTDLRVENTGNATAYDIVVDFDPPPQIESLSGTSRVIPFQRVSLLKPGQCLSSYLNEFASLKGKAFTVTVSWRRHLTTKAREQNKYLLDMRDIEGMVRLGEDDPLVQVAREIKHIREDWKLIAKGTGRIRADVYAKEDRDEERKAHEARREQFKREQQQREAQQREAAGDSETSSVTET